MLKRTVTGLIVAAYTITMILLGKTALVINTVLLLLIGVFGSLGQAFITYAYRFAPASEISIYNYSGIIFSMILGFFILGEPVKFTSVIGGALVAAASVMVYVYNNRSNKKAGDETTK